MTESINLADHLIRALLVYFRIPAFPAPISFRDLNIDSDITYHLENWNPSTQRDTVDEIESKNDTPNPQTSQIRRREEVSNSYSWTTTHTFSIGVEVSASFKVPLVGGIDTTISTEYSYGTTEATTKTTTREWEFTQDVVVSPRSKLTALLMIEKTTPRVPFTLTAALTGDVQAGWGIVVYRASVVQLIEALPHANFRIEGNTVYFRTSGVFTASEGIKAVIDLSEVPLAQPEQAPKRWSIEVPPVLKQRTSEIKK